MYQSPGITYEEYTFFCYTKNPYDCSRTRRTRQQFPVAISDNVIDLQLLKNYKVEKKIRAQQRAAGQSFDYEYRAITDVLRVRLI